MALSDFVNKQLQQLDAKMRRLAHNTMMGDNGIDEGVLIAFGRYRQMKSERDYWLEFKKKETASESTMEDMPDDDDELPPAEPAPRPLRRPRARTWGGQ